MNMIDAEINELVGKVLTNITGNIGDDTMVFTCNNGEKYQMIYYNDCCASCDIEDICGDLQDLIGSPILKAEESTSEDNPKRTTVNIEHQDSYTWTFYNLSTVKGSVTLRWYGESNGYYSESVTFEKFPKE